MNFKMYCVVLLSVLKVHVSASPMSKFVSLRQRKCALSSDTSLSLFLKTRRQGALSKLNLSLLEKNMPNLNLGPKKTMTYDPTTGYEAYWAGGNWVLQETTGDKGKDTETFCGSRCNPMYLLFGPVCIKDEDFNYYGFDNYCKFLAWDCRAGKQPNNKNLGGKNWSGKAIYFIAYKGYCRKEVATYPTKSQFIVEEAEAILKRFEEKFSKAAG